jgi:4-amino-4-deoxy-L-arabinose transferase-like glycosyltransferase
MPRPALLALLLVVLGAAALHSHFAANPTSSYQSADERSYGKLAVTLADAHQYGPPSTRMRDPLHWPPGAPALFAVAHAAFGEKASERTFDIPAAYWFQALVSLGTVLCAFAFAYALAGPWAAVGAAALVGFYPPLILASGEQVSEPLGAFLLTAALAMFAWAARRGWWWGNAIAGVLLGATVLTRADLILAPAIVAVLALLWMWRGRGEPRRGLVTAGALLAGAALVVVPWSAYASHRAGSFVPVTQGSAAPLFVGTYLPGEGNTVGMKRALEDEVKKFRPQLRGTPAFEIEAGNYMDMIAARHPSLSKDRAIRKEARANLRRYAVGKPLRFAVLMGDKVQRMWTRYARGGARHTSAPIRVLHILLVLGGLAGLLMGIWRRRSVPLVIVLAILLYSTALHTLVVSQARYNLPLMPLLLASGAAGWAMWLSSRARSA